MLACASEVIIRSIFATMFGSRLHAIVASATLALLPTIVSCSESQSRGTPPGAEFLLSTADSTFWVATTGGGVRVRGEPLILARYGNRFYELYTAAEDLSYADALLIGERLYRRDLITGDSSVVFSDTTVSHVATIYARTHPDERPLEPDEEGNPNPRTSATAQLDILELFGPFLSYEYHVDIELPAKAPWHLTRRGVVDLRTGKPSSVADLVGEARARRITTMGRQAFEEGRDSAIRARDSLSREDRRALSALERRQFDPSSFGLESIDGLPVITFGIPGVGEGSAGNLVELEPIAVDSSDALDWWHDNRPTLAHQDSLGDEHWVGSSYTVHARYDSSGQVARVSLADPKKREWLIASVTGPLRRVDWLEQPALAAADRAALRRAFDGAAKYDGNARVARGAVSTPLTPVALGRPLSAIRHVRSGRSSVRGARTLPAALTPVRHTAR